MISAKILATVAILFGTIAAGGFFLAGNVSADNTNRSSSLIERLAAKFNLNKGEVENVFNEERNARQTEMKAKFEERLAEAVKNGKITDAQKSLILNKHEELMKEREASQESWRALTPDERRASMEKRREELSSWMKSNNIPEGIFGRGMGDEGDGMRKGGNGMRRFEK